MNMTPVRVDIAKSVFHLHGVDRQGHALLRRSQRHRLTWPRFNPYARRYVPYARELHPYPGEQFFASRP